MSFKSITGQKLAVNILKNSISKQRLSHAYLFVGEQGTEKKATAYEFAKAINCETNENDACNDCLACRKIDNKNHPDIKLIEPEGKSIKIDTIRSLQREIIYKPYESDKKVYIMNNVESLTTQAANSLLKILEEPPSYAVIILIADNINLLLSTLISRCQIIRFNRISKELIKKRLIKEYQLEPKKAELFAKLARGKYAKAVKLIKDDDLLAMRNNFIELTLNLYQCDIVKLFKTVSDLLDYKEQIDHFFDICLTLHRDLLFLKLDKEELLINFDHLTKLKELEKDYSFNNLEQAINLIEEVNNTYIRRNVNLKLTLEKLFIDLTEFGR